MPYGFLGTLSESRMVPMRSSLNEFLPKQIAELGYLHMIALRILLAESFTHDWAKGYARRTTRGSNFKRWRGDATDLYILCFALQTGDPDEDDMAPFHRRFLMYASPIHRWIEDAGHGHDTDAQVERLFTRLDTIFGVLNTSMRAVRRLAEHWTDLSEHERRLAMTRLLQFMRSRAPKSDLLPHLVSVAKHRSLEIDDVCNLETGEGCERGHDAKKGSFLRSLVGTAAMGLAGAAAGYALTHRPTKESVGAGVTSSALAAAAVEGMDHGRKNRSALTHSRALAQPPLAEAAAHPFRHAVAHLTTQDTGGEVPIADLRKRVAALVNSWRGHAFHNEETGRDITIVGSAVRKTTHVGELLLRIHYALPEILRHGTFVDIEGPRDHRPGLVEMLTLGASVVLDDTLYHVVAKIRRYAATGDHHYSLHFDGGLTAQPVR